MHAVFAVKDYINPKDTDSAAIERCFKAAEKYPGQKTILFDAKDYSIDRAILVPDDTEIIIDGCSIKQNDFVFDNIFRGSNLIIDKNNPYGAPIDVHPVKNIRIIGKNGANLIGTSNPKIGYHTVLNETQKMVGDFWGWRTHMISFSRGENIEIAGLSISQTMGWAISFDVCNHIHVHDIEIRSNVKNGDGINFRSGCHHCMVENITGFTSDDTVACTALAEKERKTYPIKNYLYPSEPFGCLPGSYDRDIHNDRIKNIFTGGFHHGVICLAANGNQVYDISIENVHETKEGQREAAVKIYTGYGGGYHAGDLHHISVHNVISQISKNAVLIHAEVKDVTIENVIQLLPDGQTIKENK